MVKTFGQATGAALTNAQALSERLTGGSASASSEHDERVFFQCIRLWATMLPSRAGDDLAGELKAKGFHRMLGHLNAQQMGWLTEMVLDECEWFPTVAQCKAMMARPGYDNRLYRQPGDSIGSPEWFSAHRLGRAGNRLALETRLQAERAALQAQLTDECHD